MLLDIDEVLKQGSLEQSDSLQCDRIVKENVQVQGIDDVQVNVRAYAVEDRCAVDGSLQTVVTYVCSRCLTQFDAPLETTFYDLFSHRLAGDDEEEEIQVVKNSKVELDPYVEEAINLSINPKPLCAQDCKGLCPECGANLNEQSCDCKVDTIDPRLEALKGLLSGDESE